MAKKISSRDLFEKEDIFEGIRLSAERTIEQLNILDAEFRDLANAMQSTLKGATTTTTQGINTFVQTTQKANNLMAQSIELTKLKAQAEQQVQKANQESEKTAQQKEKTAQANLRTQQQQAKEAERVARAQEKANKAARDEANAYKRLEKNTRDLKNESKRLGAEMLLLEQSGKKNSVEYRKLSQQYQTVTSAAQKGDAQLKKLDKTVGDNFRNVGNYSGAMNRLNSVLAGVGISFGLTMAVSKLKQLVTESIDLARIQEKAVAQVQAGLESTGNKVGYTLDQLKEKASGLQKQTLFGDEAILTDVTSVLLTFTSIQGKVFDQAQQAVVDLSAKLGQDLKSSAVQLGKALNDPIKGITALKRVGVSFTESQVGLIKSLVKSGELEKAQGVILNEMAIEFGGAAKAAAKADGGFTQLNNAIGDAKEMFGSLLIEKLKPLTKGLLEFFSSLTTEDIKKFVNTLGTIATVIYKVTTAYVAYKAVILTLSLIEKARNTNFKDLGNQMLRQVPLTKQYAQAQKEAAEASKAGATNTKGFGSALGGVGWTIAIGLAIELATALYDIASGAKAAREQQALTDKYNADAEKTAGKRVSDRQKSLDKEIAELQRKRNENKITEKEFLKLKEEAVKKTQEQINSDIKSVKSRNAGYKEDLKQLEAINNKVKNGEDVFQKQADLVKKISEKWKIEGGTSWVTWITGDKDAAGVDDVLKELNSRISASGKKLEIYAEEMDGVTESVKDATSEINANSIEHEDNSKKIKAKIPKMKEMNTEFKKTNEYLSKQNELLNKLDEIERKRKIDDLQKTIDAEVEIQSKKVKETGQYDLTEFKRLNDEKQKLEISRILEQSDWEQEQNMIKYEREKQTRLDELDAEYLELKTKAKGNDSALKEIDTNYLKRKNEIANEEKLIYADVITQNQIITKEATNQIEELEKTNLEFTKSTNEELLNSQKDYLKDSAELTKDATEKELEEFKKKEQEKRAFIQATADILTKQSEKRIAQIDAEINKAQEQLDNYKKLADEGNITAQQSLAEQQRILDEANMKKEREQKRQQRIKLAESVYSTYSQKVEAGSKNPLAETIRDTTLLQQFIASLPTFLEGTEDTGLNGRGIDGKGGFHAVLHPNERVIPKNLNEKIGTLSNVELARMAQEYQNGKMIEGATQSASALEFSLLVNEIKDLKQVIKDKPETNIALGEITQSVVEIVQKRVRGNSTTYNRFKVHK